MLDFEVIKTDDLTKLVIADLSDWTDLTGSQVDILLPECDIADIITLPLGRNINNAYFLEDLEVIGERLPDGIYVITIKDDLGTTTYEKNHLRTTNLRLLRDRIFLKHITDCNFERTLSLGINLIDLYIEAAYANLRDGDVSKAKYFYNQAKSRIDKLLNCK